MILAVRPLGALLHDEDDLGPDSVPDERVAGPGPDDAGLVLSEGPADQGEQGDRQDQDYP
jgi:hypothetical protein